VYLGGHAGKKSAFAAVDFSHYIPYIRDMCSCSTYKKRQLLQRCRRRPDTVIKGEFRMKTSQAWSLVGGLSKPSKMPGSVTA
jgi:hypothetical protein